MSGHKCSSVQLSAEREQRLRLVQNVTNSKAERHALAEQLAALLDNARPAMKQTFVAEISAADAWLKSESATLTSNPALTHNVQDLQRLAETVGQDVAAGRAHLHSLSVCFSEKTAKFQQEIRRKAAALDTDFLSQINVLKLWFDNWLQDSRKSLAALASAETLESSYDHAVGEIELLQHELAQKAAEASSLQQKFQRRDYLLSSLRGVCKEMGFCELAGPKFEDPTNLGSRILFEVDTLDRGKINFSLTLDGLSSFSEIEDGKCFEEFDQLSKYLDECYGVHTAFQMADGKSLPKLKQQGEADLPSSPRRQTAH